LPSFDPNSRGQWQKEAVRNRVITDTFEPGSTMKPFSIAAAIEAGKVSPQQTIQTAPGKLTIGGRTIGDAHAYGLLTVSEVVAKSSNVGTAKIALDLPLKRFGICTRRSVLGRHRELPSAPLRGGCGRPAPGGRSSRRPLPTATACRSRCCKLARAYSVFARDGDIVPLSC